MPILNKYVMGLLFYRADWLMGYFFKLIRYQSFTLNLYILVELCIAAMKGQSQIIAYIFWETKISFNQKTTYISNESVKIRVQKNL